MNSATLLDSRITDMIIHDRMTAIVYYNVDVLIYVEWRSYKL